MPEAPARRLRRTPCVGICSTTYGDLVCRGCKRFAHEIVGWNSYEDRQRDVVWARLHRLLTASVRVFVAVADERRLRYVARQGRVLGAETAPAEVVAFRTMSAHPLPLAALGLVAKRSPLASEQALAGTIAGTRAALRCIDREFYTRSRAHYEVSFKTLT